MSSLRFAVAGTPLSTKKPGGTLLGLERAAELGIRAMELEWVQMVPKNLERMREIRVLAEKLDIRLTVHAPYYINLNSPEPLKLEASIKRILDALSMAQVCKAVSVCVHPAFYLRSTPEETFANVSKATELILQAKSSLFPDVNLAFETMGKTAQFGSFDEILRLSAMFGIYPCVDFAHLHARANGAVNSVPEWDALLDDYVASLGDASLQDMHIHYSGIAYGPKGEKHHVPLQESDAEWLDFLSVLRRRSVGGVIVVESPLLETDTLLMMKAFPS